MFQYENWECFEIKIKKNKYVHFNMPRVEFFLFLGTTNGKSLLSFLHGVLTISTFSISFEILSNFEAVTKKLLKL